MMATTVVALHLEGQRATVGHVGDSRLYRMTPDGRLRRETDDHSLVEEEVRAGRMTPEQALNHPGRNVISRALGAEAAVEVDLRTFEVENGTLFLLCSDGITRHIPDEELSALLRSAGDLEETCAEMKRLCYERGAEDNLTAVLVRVGGSASRLANPADDEVTLIRERATSARTARASSDAADSAASSDMPPDADDARAQEGTFLRRPFDGVAAPSSETSIKSAPTSNVRADEPRKKSGSLAVPVALVLVLGAAALAFYVGMMYERKGPSLASGNAAKDAPRTTVAEPTPAASAASPSPAASGGQAMFESRRAAVDLSPASEIERMKAQAGGDPLTADDPELLYLYGRALLLVDRQQDAVRAFDLAIQKAGDNMTARNGELKIDALLAKVAAQVRGGDSAAANDSARALDGVIRTQQQQQTGTDGNVQPTPGVTP
jgi:protein phosphatase